VYRLPDRQIKNGSKRAVSHINVVHNVHNCEVHGTSLLWQVWRTMRKKRCYNCTRLCLINPASQDSSFTTTRRAPPPSWSFFALAARLPAERRGGAQISPTRMQYSRTNTEATLLVVSQLAGCINKGGAWLLYLRSATNRSNGKRIRCSHYIYGRIFVEATVSVSISV
jgi:hypothetical protein